MDPFIRDILKDAQKHPLHEALFNFVEGKLKKSRSNMQKHYASWDAAHSVYLSERKLDKEDVEAVKQGLPRKITVPLTSSQILTGIAFGYTLLTQRKRFYEFDPTEDADRPVRECGEILVERDMCATDYKKRLAQFLLNIFVYGLAVEKDCWHDEYVYLPIQRQGQQKMYNGQPIGEIPVITKVEKVLRRSGNIVRSISPYSVFPDAGFHISDYQRGSFIGTDDEYTWDALHQLQSEGMVEGVDHIKKYNHGSLATYVRDTARFSFDLKEPDKADTVVITEWVGKLNPAKITADGKSLGDDEVAHNWLIWIANDDRIIRAEPMTYLHAQYGVSLGMFLPDMHSTLVNSLPMQIGDLQELTSWFMNSRMAAVSRTVDNQMVVDPIGIEIADVVNRQRIIRMTKQGSGKDVRRFLTPLEVRDSTTGHVADMQNLVNLTQQTSGINDNLSGQFNGGRRSATEARSVNQGAAGRMKMIFDIVWDMAYRPQGNRLLLNQRQSIDEEEFRLVCGEAAMEHFMAFKSTPEALIRSYDYIAYDGTLPSDKLFLAQSLQEIFSLLVANPMAAAAFNIDPAKVLKDMGTLRGMGQFGNYAFTQEDASRMLATQFLTQAQQGGGQPTNNPAAA